MQLRSEAPKVTLAKAFTTPFDNAVATARTCYSSRVITDDDVRKNLPLRDKIAQSTYKAGHHTTLQHAHFEFTIDGVSRHALWSYFHAHPFYNSEQVSQRYVEVKAGRVLRPSFDHLAHGERMNARYDACVARQMDVYHQLIDLLGSTVGRLYFGLFPARRREVVDKRWSGAMQKRAQEVARYVLPIGTHAHLYHTISGLTLHRYHRTALSHDCPSETKAVVDEMVRLVREFDPGFMSLLQDALPLEQSLDAQVFTRANKTDDDTRAFVSEFDHALAQRTSALVSMTQHPAAMLGACLREVLGVPKAKLDDDQAVRLLLDPKDNRLLSEQLSLLTLQKVSRVLEMVHVTFQKKLSHTADSQEQRHRMTPGARPLLSAQLTPNIADYVLPVIFLQPDAAQAREVFEREMHAVFADVQFLAQHGASPEQWQYLLPNAVPVRFTETGSLLDLHHKWTTRLCYNAQEEIWRATLDEVEQVKDHAPLLAEFLLPPCGQRARAEVGPFCPEGERFCGEPVWKKTRSQYLRVL